MSTFLKLINLFQLENNYFATLWWFCHISTWISHKYTCVPHPHSEPLTHLLLHHILLGFMSAFYKRFPNIFFFASTWVKEKYLCAYTDIWWLISVVLILLMQHEEKWIKHTIWKKVLAKFIKWVKNLFCFYILGKII